MTVAELSEILDALCATGRGDDTVDMVSIDEHGDPMRTEVLTVTIGTEFVSFQDYTIEG